MDCVLTLSLFLLQSEYSLSSENGEPSESVVAMKNGYLGQDSSSTRQAELSVEEKEDENSSSRMPNLAGPWQKMPLMGQSAESEASFAERVFKRLCGDIPRTERFRVLWLSVRCCPPFHIASPPHLPCSLC